MKDTELIRFNPVMIDADMSINVIPDHVKIGTDVRYLNLTTPIPSWAGWITRRLARPRRSAAASTSPPKSATCRSAKTTP
nr:hypothetical protein [Lacticaseibacillus nasuensis]